MMNNSVQKKPFTGARIENADPFFTDAPGVVSEIVLQRRGNHLNESMFNDYGFIFDAKANALLYQGGGGGTFSTEDFLNYQSLGRVLQRRQGICLSLTTLYLIIGDRLKIPVYGVI